MPDKHNAGRPPESEPPFDELLTTADVARLTGLSERTVGEYRTARNRRYGPPFVKYGNAPLYRLSEVLEWMDGRAGGKPSRRQSR